MNVRFIPLAKREMMEASRFYEKRIPGLGDAFLDEIGRTLGLLKRFPSAWPIVHGSRLRRIRLRRFPYGLVYRVDDETIVVFAVAHLKRRQQYWARRLSRF